jgi:hypothetical protein
MHPFDWDNDPLSELRIPPNSALHLMNAIRAVQVIMRSSAVLDRIHLPNYRFSYFKPLAVDMDICPAASILEISAGWLPAKRLKSLESGQIFERVICSIVYCYIVILLLFVVSSSQSA